MAQIIRHRKGVLESVNGSTKRKAELLIVTGSSGITSTNSDAMVFFGDGTDATAANKVLYGSSTPNLTGASYGDSINGIPYYNTSENKLYLLGKSFTDGKLEVQASANTGGTGIISSSAQIAELGANIYSSSAMVAADLLSDNRNIDLGTGTFDAGTLTSDGTLNVTGISNLGVISGSNMDLTGNANIQGNITLGGNITIGDASSDTIAFGGDVSTDIIPNADNSLDLGSSTDRFAQVHAASFLGALTGQVNATNNIVSSSSDTANVNLTISDGVVSAELYGGVVSGSSQISADQTDGWAADVKTQLNTNTVISGSSQVVLQDADKTGFTGANSITTLGTVTAGNVQGILPDGTISGSAQLLNVATDFGSGRVSGEDIGDVLGTSTFTGSFVGSGAGLTGLATDLTIGADNGSDDTVSLSTGTLNIVGTANEIETTVTNDQIAVGIVTNPTLTGNVTVTGNFEVQGTTTTVSSTTVQLDDNILSLNGTGAANGGIQVADSNGPASGSLLWDGSNNRWIAGGEGSEQEILLRNVHGVISGSSQVSADQTDGWVTDVRTQLDNVGVVSGSGQIAINDTDGTLTTLGTVTAGSVTAILPTGTVSGSSQVTGIVNSQIDANAAIIHTKLDLRGSGIQSGSSQITANTDVGEALMKASDGSVAGFNAFSDGVDLFSIGTATGNVQDLGSGNQLALYNGSGNSGILSYDLGGTIQSYDYATATYRYIDTNSGVGVALKPNADANKAWLIDTDGDLVSNATVAGAATTGSIYAANVIARGDLSGSNLKLTGNANIDGNIVLGGNITIGDSSSDTIAFGGDLSTDIIPNANNTLDLGSSTDKFAEVHATTFFGNVTGNVTGTINANNGVISGSAQLLNVATDFGSGRVSGDNFGDADGGSTFTGSFVGSGAGLTGLATDLSIAGDSGTDTVSLSTGTLTFGGGTGVSAAITDDTVTYNVQDGSTSAKGIASFSSTNFSVSSGNVSLLSGNGVDSSGGVLGANLNADVAGTGLSYSLSNQDLNVDYGSSAGQAVQGNTTISVSGTTNEIEITGTTAQALGGGASYTIGLPSDVTIGNDLTVTTDAAVGGNMTVTGNLSVLGTTTTVDSTTVQIGDNILELNYGGAQTNAGLLVTDTQAPNQNSGSLLWDGTNDHWMGGAAGSEKEFARLNATPTTNTVLKADSNGLLVDSVLSDDGTDATFSGDLIVTGLSAGANGAFLYADANEKLQAVNAATAGDVIQWNGSSFVASNELDGGTF